MRRVIAIAGAALMLALLFCSEPSNPVTDPLNGRIIANRSLQFGSDNLSASQEYACTVRVALPEHLDSLFVYVTDSAGTVLLRADAVTADDTLLIFPLQVLRPGQLELKVVVRRKEHAAGADSLVKTFTAYDFSPVVSSVNSRIEAVIGDSVALTFTVTDSDNDIFTFVLIAESGGDTIVRIHAGGGGVPALTENISVRPKGWGQSVWLAAAFDREGNVSGTLPCTVMVVDTTPPALGYIYPDAASTLIVSTLPCTIRVSVFDDVPVDSVKFAGRIMERSGDTVFIGYSEFPDTIAHPYQVVAWNRAGLCDSLTVSLRYKGTVKYTPRISKLSGQRVLENQKFALVRLDSLITLDTVEAGFGFESLTWEVNDEVDTAGLRVTLNTAERTVQVYVAPADSEWSGSEGIKFRVSAPNGTQDFNSATFTVDSINDPPRLIDSIFCMKSGQFDTIFVDTIAFDPDNRASSLSWPPDSVMVGKYFRMESVMRVFSSDIGREPVIGGTLPKSSAWLGWTRRWRVVQRTGVSLPSNWTADTMSVSVSDGKASSYRRLILKSSCLSIRPIDPLLPVPKY